MQNWKDLLNGDPTDWLLEESNPSVRYFALRWLLDKPEGDPEVAATSRAIAQSEPVAKFLRSQRPKGYWGPDPRPHHGTEKYLVLLLWLGYKGDGAIRKAMDYLLDGCILEDGAYGMEIKGHTVYLPCHAAHALRLMLWYGYADDPRARRIVDWLLSVQHEEGGWPCISKVKGHSCFWATAAVLQAFDDLPSDWLTPQIEESRRRAVELFLNSGLYKHHREWGKPSPRWFQFGFPMHWETDILQVLGLVAPYVSPDDERIQEGLRLVLSKQDERGRWPCEAHPKGGKWFEKFVPLEKIGQPSKWVTLHALRMLKRLHK
jgi:hypothetical protein